MKKIVKHKKKMGRPQIEINWEDFDKLCSYQCTLEEIASWFDCSMDTIERAVKREFNMTFADKYVQKAAKGKISLRRSQWKLAFESLNPTMLIWLGKQYLDQKEKVETQSKLEVEQTFKIGFADEENDKPNTSPPDPATTKNSEIK